MKHLITNLGDALKLLAFFKEQGYDRIHMPGGTSVEGNHFSGVLPYWYNPEDKHVYFVGVPYASQAYKKELEIAGQFPRSQKPFGESPEATACRETFEEIGVKVNPLNLTQVHYQEKDDNRNPGKGLLHRMYYFMVNIAKGSGELSSFDGPNPIDPETLAPVLFRADVYAEVLFAKHDDAFYKALGALAMDAIYFRSVELVISNEQNIRLRKQQTFDEQRNILRDNKWTRKEERV